MKEVNYEIPALFDPISVLLNLLRVEDGLIYSIEGDRIYDRDWNLKGRVKDGEIYDRNWNRKGHIRKRK